MSHLGFIEQPWALPSCACLWPSWSRLQPSVQMMGGMLGEYGPEGGGWGGGEMRCRLFSPVTTFL